MARATITIEAFVAKDPETRTVTGHTITSVTLPVTPQKKDGNGGYVDNGDTVWYQAEFWDEHGQAVAQEVHKGQLVTVTGNIEIQTREKDGKTYTNTVITFPTISVIVRKPSRGAGGSTQTRQGGAQASVDEPWAATAQTGAQGADAWGQESPF
ncbi:single-stranded DNA-binding protein [Cryobacterium sp. PH31-AA6]|uniref:single-stranded DNA-binding protein n=1 Tax=Cryobacterium sp. PH31-AA6 TaxID=3046205 RepID=UPI0024BBD6A9|nr:single-stranded DNA-binding protein [Cryobacterium sp. PH31-AA6]MDJ0323188.1 single-stranded DNA-binding protein [Cryobacterium sp. PH31-AA6]